MNSIYRKDVERALHIMEIKTDQDYMSWDSIRVIFPSREVRDHFQYIIDEIPVMISGINKNATRINIADNAIFNEAVRGRSRWVVNEVLKNNFIGLKHSEMTEHTIILELPKIEIPEHNAVPFLIDKLKDPETEAKVDYFGGELDNCLECDADDDFFENYKTKTYLSLHFSGEELDYQMDESEALKLARNKLQFGRIVEVRNDLKDVDIYISSR